MKLSVSEALKMSAKYWKYSKNLNKLKDIGECVENFGKFAKNPTKI